MDNPILADEPAPHTIASGRSRPAPAREPVPVGLVVLLAMLATLALIITTVLALASQMPH